MNKLLTFFVNLFEPISKFVAIIAGYALVGLSIMITYDVVARKVFNASSVGTDEVGGYIVAIMAAFGFTYALLQHAHTRIDVFLKFFKGRLRAFFNAFALLCISIYASFMAWRAIDTLIESIHFGSRANTPLRTPQWIPQSLWACGLIIFALATILLTIHALWLLFRGKFEKNIVLYSPKTLQEEIKEEIVAVEGFEESANNNKKEIQK